MADAEQPYRWALIGLLVGFTLMRWYFVLRFRKPKANQRGPGWVLDEVLVRLTVMAMVGLPVAYVSAPAWIAWAAWPLPAAVRWLGSALGLGSVALVAWAHAALREAFSPHMDISTEQRLTTGGPYRYVRHPMYAALWLYWLATSLIAANWAVGGVGAAVFGAMLLWRLPREEQMMVEAFGDAYKAYMGRTGAMFPRRRGH